MTFVSPIEYGEEADCPAAVLSCVDWRWRKADQEFVEKELGFAKFDLFSWPESNQELLKNNGFKKSFIEKVVSLSLSSHNIKKLILLWHWENGQNSQEATEEQCRLNLQKAKELLAAELPDDLEIIMAYSKITPQGLEYSLVD